MASAFSIQKYMFIMVFIDQLTRVEIYVEEILRKVTSLEV